MTQDKPPQPAEPFLLKPVPACRPGFSDHVYKVAHGVSIPLRLWPATEISSKPAPWLLWIHGGGFIGGKWSAPNAWVTRAFADRGYHVVSIGYRLTPQVGIQEQIEDCTDAYSWCRNNLSTLVGPGLIDIDRWVVGGDSAGGALSTLCGHLLNPPPKAVIDVYGLVDPTDPWFHEPRSIPKRPFHVAERDEDELARAVADRDPRNAETQNPWSGDIPPMSTVEQMRAHLGMPDFEVTDKVYFRIDLSNYMGFHRLMMPTIYRRENYRSDEEFKDCIRSLSPLHMLQGKDTYPPTFFMHGTADVLVPVHQSYKMAAELKAMGVDVGEVYCEGAGHVFDLSFETPKDKGWDEHVVPCMEFLDKHV